MVEPHIVVNKPWKVHLKEQRKKQRLELRVARLVRKLIAVVVIGTIIILSRVYLNIFVVIIEILVLILFLFRRRIFKKRGKKGWKKIDKLPKWAYKKMKKRKKNIVNGKHYVYKRDGNKFFKKRK